MFTQTEIDNLITKLTSFGISRAHARIYIALISRGESSATELAKATGIHRVDIYKKMNGILKLGLGTVKLGRPVIYQATNPDTVLDSIIESKSKNVQDLEQAKIELQTKITASMLEGSFQENEKEPMYKLIIGRRQGYDESRRLLRLASKSVDRVVSPIGLRRNYNFKILEEYRKCSEKGIRVRLISELTKVPKKIIRFCASNFDLRHSSESAMRLLIVDRKFMLFSGVYNDYDMSISSMSDRYLLVQDENFTQIVSLMFEHLWSSSKSPDIYLRKK